MAPVRMRDPSIERTDEYEKFMKELEVYHEKRGTILEREPKVGPRHIDLFRLYKKVTEEGGYDVVSDTKGNKLAWRRIASDFMPASANLTQLAFLLKTAYYKNLAAYEITTFHKREPPPKEILEDVTAKGGDLLSRTLENYPLSSRGRELEVMQNGEDSDVEAVESQKTPSGDKMDVDEPGSTGGRVVRGLRNNPPQRALFNEPRQTRQSANQAQSPTPGAMNGNSASSTIANYEPRPAVPATVKPVVTPGNNPEYFRSLRAKALAQRRAARNAYPARGVTMAPGTGFVGPNIYSRTLMALKSHQSEEVAYALHHLVKISHERGDKYRFDGFPGLAEALVEKVLDVSSLFYNVKWDISYSEDGWNSSNDMLNGITGTPDLLPRIQCHALLVNGDDIETEEFARTLGNVNEAALVLRNMIMLEDNSRFLSKLPLIKDLVAICLNLPRQSSTVELQHYALEMAEQLTRYYSLGPNDPLYVSLLAQVCSNDRGAIITSLRALSFIAMNLEVKNNLSGVPIPTLQLICDWLLVEDEDLRSACLDFLYQFTAVTENVLVLLQHTNSIPGLVAQLIRLLMHGATHEEVKSRSAQHKRQPTLTPETPPKLSIDIVKRLCAIPDDKDQSSEWLRTCFEEDPTHEITQIALWQAYQEIFVGKTTRQLMSAKDFIQNVSATFAGATAQVIPGPPAKYTMKGLKPRTLPVDSKGRPYRRCLWRALDSTGARMIECDNMRTTPRELWEHIVSDHLRLEGLAQGSGEGERLTFQFPSTNNSTRRWMCRWSTCQRFPPPGEPNARVVAEHVKTHLPDASPTESRKRKLEQHNLTDEQVKKVAEGEQFRSKTYLNTAMDERMDAAGLPLASVLVLRNLARQMGKIDRENAKNKEEGEALFGAKEKDGLEEEGWVRKIFAPWKEELYYVLAWNWALTGYVRSLTTVIADAGGW